VSSFDTLDHGWMVEFLEHRIADRRVVRLIQKWLTAGVLEDGKRTRSEMGTVQGGSISPLLANVYLHYVFDLWVQQWRSKQARGDAIVVRSADDCAPRRRGKEAEEATRPQLCCVRDEGRPLGAGVQAQAPNHRELLRSRAGVVSVTAKGAARPRQVKAMKTNASEPLMTCRKRRDGVKTGLESLARDEPGGSLLTGWAASGMKAA